MNSRGPCMEPWGTLDMIQDLPEETQLANIGCV